jgi:hypothetical protein
MIQGKIVSLTFRATLLSILCVMTGGFSVKHEKEDRAKLVAGSASSALQSSNKLSTAFSILNEGEDKADSVQATEISLQDAKLSAPATLPIALGTIRHDAQATVFATFTGKAFLPGNTYAMEVEGTFKDEDRRTVKFTLKRRLRIPPTSPGSAEASSSSSPPNVVSGAPYPHQPPNFPREVNRGHGGPVPTGTYHAPTLVPPATSVQPAPAADPPTIDFVINNSLGLNGGSVNEPSGGVGGGVVFVTANFYAAYSTDGVHFTQLDPTTIFPNNVNGGFCCDQLAVYIPSIDRVIWVLQYASAQGQTENRYRIAAASPAIIQSSNGTSWTYWDITSTQLGDTTDSLDYPDLSVGDNSLYLNFDEDAGRVVARIPLSEIHDGVTINFRYTNASDSSMAIFAHLTQDARDEIFWAGHIDNSHMRVFNWLEGSNTYFWRDVQIESWPNDNRQLTSMTPDNQDWVSKLREDNNNFISGSTRVISEETNEIWFAWTAPSGSGFQQPQVQWVALDRNDNFRLITQQQIWNNNYAFAYPALAANSNGEVGLSLIYGGGGNYTNHVVGFWGDFVVYITTASNVGVTRSGDYVTIRQDVSNPAQFDAFGFGVQNIPSIGIIGDTHYVVFGRP